MAIHQDDFSASPRQPLGRAATDDIGRMLERLTGQIQSRIVEVEQRHAEALHHMQDKLERMTGTASRARPAMPSELAAAFSRIEAGMTDLVDRISESVPERRQGAGFVFGAAKPEHKHFVFDPPKRAPVAPVTYDADSATGEPWDANSAEALAHMYESGEAALAKHLPEAALFAGQRATARPMAAESEAIRAPVGAKPAVPSALAAPVVVAGLGDDRTWLDKKLTAIAAEVTQSIGAAQSDGALKTLMSRVDQFEARFSTALDGLARKSDITEMRQDVVKQIEQQIVELAGHIDQTHQQLTRLDAIEQQLADLTAFAHASMDTGPAAEGAPAAPAAEHNYEQLADLAVERAIARLQTPLAASATPDEAQTARVDAVHALLEEFQAERRRGDEYTTGMLETVQEALIRLIDRVDAIDAANARAPAAPLHQEQTAAPTMPVYSTHASEPVEPAAPAMKVAAPAVNTIQADSPPSAPPRRRVRITPAAPEAQAPAEMDQAAAAAEQQGQPEISIKDIKIGPKGVRAMVPPASPDANLPEPEEIEDEQPAPKPARAARKTEPKAASGSAGKRGLYVAAAALSLVGIGFLAQNLLTRDADAPPVAPVAAPALPGIAPATAVPKAAPPAARPNPAPSTPPGMMPAPQTNGQRSNVVPRPEIGGTGTATAPRGPSTTPETVSDDLSLNDTDDTDTAPAPTAVAAAPRQSSPTYTGLPGMALAGSMPTTGQQFTELNGLQRQANQALASERIGFNARPASDFSSRFGAPVAPAPAAAPTAPASSNAAAIVTGSTSATEAIGEPADMPPALVGPVSLRMAAARGDASASFEVATRFAEGRGIKQDFKQAIVWYQRAANKNLAIAQYRLGTLYERGLGTAADPAKAKGWYKRAADQGNVKAMHNMAVMSAGNGQTAPDYAAAAKWFKEAADRGLADSQFNLGVLYENGLGVEKDARQAYIWFSLAARAGDQEATRRRDQIMATLDTGPLAEANDAVQTWRARATDPKINDPRVAGDQWRATAAAASEQHPVAQASVAAAPTGGPRTIRVPSTPR